ncbi:prephenate dehydrogenase [Rubritalea marina]|uniref:prephenate dehydrogenase n=1 Tax=Rubritalea marina TaxID=361055 RepID=UPI00036BBEAF|nr:prephenate dehydrogenase/arogenate dehydrogenase family protein [Rubritalea marina]
MINKLAILGPGLLGGSIALAVQQQCPELELSLWGRREQPIALAKSLGIAGATSSLQEALEGCDLVILATPVGVMAQMVEQIKSIVGDRRVLLTDVGSVKRLPHASIAPIIEGSQIEFIGSHPMAGSEKAGMEAATVGLIQGATCLLTNDNKVAEEKVAALEQFWRKLGCSTRRMTAEDHDYAVARVSHFPHVLASVGASVGLSFEDITPLCGGGMRDTTRVAAGDPDLWTEILMENRDALQRSMRESIADLLRLMDCLEKEDREQLYEYLETAKKRRALI